MFVGGWNYSENNIRLTPLKLQQNVCSKFVFIPLQENSVHHWVSSQHTSKASVYNVGN